MKKPKNSFLKNLRYLCLVGVIALGLMTIVGSGGGGGGGAPTTTPPPTDGGDGGGGDGDGATIGEVIDTNYVTFSVNNAVSLVATENIASQSARRSVRKDGKRIPTYVFRKFMTEEEAKARSATAQRQDEDIGCNLLSIDENGVASDALESLEELNVMYTVLSKDGKKVFVVLDPDYAYNAVNTIGNTNCMMFAVDLETNEYTCLDPGYAPQKIDDQFRTTISSGRIKPIQMDDTGNIYYLGRPFTPQGHVECVEWDNYGNCVSEQMRYDWIEYDWNVNPVIRKIPVTIDEDGNPSYNENGYLIYGDSIGITPDINYISSFLVSRDGLIVYTFENWDTGDGGIKMYDAISGATNALTDDTSGWWGDMFYVIGDGGTVIYGSGTMSWETGGVKFAQRHPTLTGGRLIYKLDTSLFTARGNQATPNRIMIGDDGYIYGLFNEDTSYCTDSGCVTQARINLFRILPYKQTPIVSIEVVGDWWNAMRGFDVQIAKGYAYYVQQQKHPSGAYGARDVIKITKLATGVTNTLLQDALWQQRYEIYSWKLVGDIIHFSAWDGPGSQVVTGTIDVVKVRQGKPVDEYLNIEPAASALGESARIRDMEVLTPPQVYDPVGAPKITKIYTDPENRYSVSIDFTKYMNREDVNSKVSIVNTATTEPSPAEAYEEGVDAGEWVVDEYLEDDGLTGLQVSANPSIMKVWSYRTLHLIIDNPVLNDDGYALVNATTDPLDPDTEYEVFVDPSAFDAANEQQLDMAYDTIQECIASVSKRFTTVPDHGWYQSTAIALEDYSDGSVGRYVRGENVDTSLDFFRLLGTKNDDGTWTGTSVKNFKLEISLQYLGDSWHHWNAVVLRLNDAQLADWTNVDWSEATITDGNGDEWEWRDGYREDDEGKRYSWCNYEHCEKPLSSSTWIDGVYRQDNGYIYIHEQGCDVDVDGNKYYWYWDDDLQQGGYEQYNPDGVLLRTIVWVDGYYTDEAGTKYVWSFGEYRDENNSENILDWESGQTYTWHSGYYKDKATDDLFEMPYLEWQPGRYVATYDSNGNEIVATDPLFGDSFSENSWWNWDETMGYYVKIDGFEDTPDETTQTYWGDDWTSTVPPDYVENTKKDNWEARLFRAEFDASGHIYGEYRYGDWNQDPLQGTSTSDEEKKREWRKIIVKAYGSNLVISVLDENGETISSAIEDNYLNAPQDCSETYFLDLNVNSNLLMDNITVTELNENGTDAGGTPIFEETFSNARLSSTWSNPGQYTSEW
ncbi:MAG: hypothetical protein JRJ70_13725 [Deltaproteobacteria bacterium]|nr:hypothetical protein [Deltaproteobacteria bacterium]